MPSDEYNRVRARAQCLLARREHSRLELQQKLVNKGFDEIIAESVIAQLASEGLQSDERFTESYVRVRTGSGFGPVRIRYELKQKGINAPSINEHVSLLDEQWIERAYQVLTKKFDVVFGGDINIRRKQARFLSYRGFTQDQIYAALSQFDKQEYRNDA